MMVSWLIFNKIMGLGTKSIIFDCSEQEHLCLSSILLVVVDPSGGIKGVETIGRPADYRTVQTAIESVSSKASDIFKFYGFN